MKAMQDLKIFKNPVKTAEMNNKPNLVGNQQKKDHFAYSHSNSDLQTEINDEEVKAIQIARLKVAIKVWNRLKEGCSSWTYAYGENIEDNRTWLNALLLKSDEQLERGLNGCLMTPSKYAPTVSMFNFHCVMGAVPKKYTLYERLYSGSTDCKYTVWLRKNISSRFFQANENIGFQIFEEAYQALYEYMQYKIDVPDIEDDKSNEGDKKSLSNNEWIQTQNTLKILKDYLNNLD